MDCELKFSSFWIDECDSTNSYVRNLMAENDAGVIVAARSQTAGRGQKGNSWEAEPGKNLTFSAAWTPRKFAARDQFSISEAVALAVVDLLAWIGVDAKVKWPNDIYVGDRKICGILIEHSVMGMDISGTVAGVGININQREFFSDAPNPVSVIQLTGTELPLERLLDRYAELLEARLRCISVPEGRLLAHEEFKENMWRFDGKPYPFRDVASGAVYSGCIEDVEPSGLLHVRDSVAGGSHKYAFKEVEFLLSGVF